MDLLEKLDEILKLQPTGNPDEMKALCPFHPDTRPSLFLNSVKKVWYCFGCGEGGRLETLARRLKISISERETESDTDEKTILEHALSFFKAKLAENAEAREALARRSRDKFILRYQLGYGATEEELVQYFAQLGVSKEDLFESPLYSNNRKYLFDKRIIIPLFNNDTRALVGFIGRALDERQPKYVYSRELRRNSVLYVAGEITGESAKKHLPLVVVESTFDAMHLASYGIPAIAILGSVISVSQFQKILTLVLQSKREVAFWVEDEAGLRGALRFIEYFAPYFEICSAKVIFQDRDADELANLSELLSAIGKAKPIDKAIAHIVSQLNFPPDKIAVVLAQLPAKLRSMTFYALESVIGRAALREVSQHLRRYLSPRRSTQKPEIPQLVIWVLAARLQNRIGFLPEIHPELYQHSGPLAKLIELLQSKEPSDLYSEQLEPDVERMLAFLTLIQLPPVPTDELISAIIKLTAKQTAKAVLRQAIKADADGLQALRQQFYDAISVIQQLPSVFEGLEEENI